MLCKGISQIKAIACREREREIKGEERKQFIWDNGRDPTRCDGDCLMCVCVCVCNSTPTTINLITVCVVYRVCCYVKKENERSVFACSTSCTFFSFSVSFRSSAQQAVFQFQVCFQLKTYYMLTSIAAYQHYFIVSWCKSHYLFHRVFVCAQSFVTVKLRSSYTHRKLLKHTQNCNQITNKNDTKIHVKELVRKRIN